MRRKGTGRALLLMVASSLAAILVAAILCGVLVIAIGVDPLCSCTAMLIEGVLFNPYGLAQVFFKATPLILTGLSVSLAFRAGLFNIGRRRADAGRGLCLRVGRLQPADAARRHPGAPVHPGRHGRRGRSGQRFPP